MVGASLDCGPEDPAIGERAEETAGACAVCTVDGDGADERPVGAGAGARRRRPAGASAIVIPGAARTAAARAKKTQSLLHEAMRRDR